jgi:acetyl-CoA C-acetyltransferase
MRRYMHEYGVAHEDFAPFSMIAHQNAVGNENARFRRAITAKQFADAPMICDPIGLMDSSPVADGAAAVVLCASNLVRAPERAVRIRGSAVATDCLSLHDRRDPLALHAVQSSAIKAYAQAGIGPDEIDFFEYHDAFTVMAALSLEASGFAGRGQATHLAREGALALDGRIPVATMGGLKGRGHPVGATGVYQIVEAVQQLRGRCGPNQVPDARVGMTQNIGGSGATVITHILDRPD